MGFSSRGTIQLTRATHSKRATTSTMRQLSLLIFLSVAMLTADAATCRQCSKAGYDCKTRTLNYIVKCYGSDLRTGKCLAHVMSVNRGGNGSCQPCCFDADCGSQMRRCGTN